MSTVRLLILGSSAGRASAHRAASCYLVDLGEFGVMIDCGDGATRNFLAAGYQPEWVSHILISHTHADHVCGLPYFIQQRYLARTENPLTICCPREAIAPLKQLLIFGHLYPESMPFETVFVPIQPRHAWSIGGAVFAAYPTSHLAPQRAFAAEHGYPDPGECFAFRMQLAGKSLLYSADLGSLDDLNVITHAIDWLLIETSHVDLKMLRPWAEERGIKRIILTHLSDDFDMSQLALPAKYTSAEIIVAKDGMALDLDK